MAIDELMTNARIEVSFTHVPETWAVASGNQRCRGNPRLRVGRTGPPGSLTKEDGLQLGCSCCRRCLCGLTEKRERERERERNNEIERIFTTPQ